MRPEQSGTVVMVTAKDKERAAPAKGLREEPPAARAPQPLRPSASPCLSFLIWTTGAGSQRLLRGFAVWLFFSVASSLGKNE